MKIYSNFLLEENQTLLPFSKKQSNSFNYVAFENTNIVSNDEARIYKEKSTSGEIFIDSFNYKTLKELKVTNQGLVTWDDLWIDSEADVSIDPRIECINLQRNSLVYVNINEARDYLRELNLEGNETLKSVTITKAQALEVLDLTNCSQLEVVNLGLSKNIKVLSLKNCRLTEANLQNILCSFTPTKTESGNIIPGTLPPFRKKFSTLLDLTGNEINWGNRKIASKIRLLVSNNWLVLWDNPPPTSVIPIQMYAFFPRNIGDKQIEGYYTGMQIQQIPPTPTPTAGPTTDPSSQPQAAAQAAQASQASAPAPAQSQSSPSPAPQPTPSPNPSPTPAPQPTPSPTPSPSPAPSPSPSPSPSPTPSPSPSGGYGGGY